MHDEKNRCPWCLGHPAHVEYHDREWGVPVHDDRTLFEFLILEGAQAGLSWLTILNKREAYRRAYDNFDPEKVARYGDGKKAALLANAGIVRNRLKVEASVTNARAFLAVVEEFGAFGDYMWRFTNGEVVKNAWKDLESVPATSPEAEAMSRDLKKRGFKFVGPTICYAHMQAVGMVNDHLTDCFRYEEVGRAQTAVQG